MTIKEIVAILGATTTWHILSNDDKLDVIMEIINAGVIPVVIE